MTYFSSGREFVSALGEPFGEDPSDEEEPDDEDVAPAELEGTGIQGLPVMDRSTPEGLRLVESGKLETIDGQLCVVEDGSGQVFATNAAIACKYLAPKVEPCCELAPFVESPQLLAALARIPSSAKLPPGQIAFIPPSPVASSLSTSPPQSSSPNPPSPRPRSHVP